MSQSNTPNDQAGGPTVTPAGGAAILAPVSAFPNGIPSNALILIPLGANPEYRSELGRILRRAAERRAEPAAP